jgi:hypothetical protein
MACGIFYNVYRIKEPNNHFALTQYFEICAFFAIYVTFHIMCFFAVCGGRHMSAQKIK